ncbi:Lrp/AsnC family transcriptional regulator [Tateyamaria sp. SN3-11]|uniref:Lrp/AsnC family transcriptional regulator n=1 Tax=Tateyamaria sp. SN3-11 TaxID=3092147 RepID=UPI0039ED79D6
MKPVDDVVKIAENVEIWTTWLSMMDDLDLRIVAALQADGTLTKAELADAVGSTPSTCLRRLADLRRTGILARCVYLADPAKLGRGIRAIINVTTRNHTKDMRTSFAARISDEPAITQAYGVTGDLDAVLIGHFGDMEEYQALCDRLFDSDPDVVRYTTLFAVETYKDSTIIAPLGQD